MRCRTLRNWCNCQPLGQPWQPTAPALGASVGVPDNWDGVYDFASENKAAALQSFTGDTSDIDNPAMVGCRLADDPDVWVNIKACDVLRPASSVVGTKQRWSGLWIKTELECEVASGKMVKRLIFGASGHPLIFRYTLRLADGLSLEFANNAARILDDKGVERMRLLAPWGHDSSTTYPSFDGSKPIRATLREGASRLVEGRQYQVVEVEVSAEDLEGAVYPVTIENDPTVQITGTINIEDVFLYSIAPEYNYGGSIYAIWGDAASPAARLDRQLFRFDENQIPAGSILSLELHYWRLPWSNSTLGGVSEIYRVKDANDWGEGTANGSAQVGSCAWNFAKYDTQSWAGSLGCGSSGIDYDADGSPPGSAFPSYTAGPPVKRVEVLKPEWATDWRPPGAARVNNGILIRGDDETTPGKALLASSTEESFNNPYFEIDYDEGGASVAAMSLSRRIHE